MDSAIGEKEIEFAGEPCIGLEFDSADDALKHYTSYAKRTGFKVRIGQLYRSRTDGSVSSRRFVCLKEGYQLGSRTGCPAFIRVRLRDSGKWVVDHFLKEHNHDLQIETESENSTPTLQQKGASAINSFVSVPHRPRKRSLDEAKKNKPSCSFGIISFKCVRKEVQSRVEPYQGQEFSSANEAYQFYHAYAAHLGFGIRFGQLFRSKNDGLITSRRFLCSKEGFQHPSRVGCGAYLRIKRQPSGKWVVDRLRKDHNHNLDSQKVDKAKSLPASSILTGVDAGLSHGDLFTIDNYPVSRGSRQNHIKSDWYSMISEYFQSRQAEDTGFFYSVEVDNGNCMSIFWADGRSRYSCSRFGDVVFLDTCYRKSVDLVPFATFVGINHHKQPVLLGCALIADESEESFTWLFRTWLSASSGRQPLSIIADQDIPIQKAIAKVFPTTRHRFSLWQIKAKEQQNVGLMGNGGFTNEYEKWIYQSRTADEFEATWNSLLNKYGLNDNAWLKDMYEKRASWVPLYLRGVFFAGIPMNGSVDSFFGALFNAQTPVMEFISRYERGLERRREEERKEDFNTSNFQPILQTKEPVEEQCRRLYTLTIFKVFQKELLQCYSYLGFKIYEERGLSRYLVRRCGNDMEKYFVTFSASSNLSISCSCQMFEYEGVLCRHALRVFQILELREVPSRYILHRWMRNADDGVFPDMECWGSSQELRNLMLWSLRDVASKHIDVGATSTDKYKLANDILREGGRKLCWPR